MAEFVAASGAKVVINTAPFKDVMALKSAIGKELANSSFNLPLDMSLKNLKDVDFDIAAFGKLILLVDSSEEVNKHLFSCLARCLRNDEKITLNTFEIEDARQDYYEIVISCLKVNLSPFLKALISQLPQIAAVNLKQS